MLESSENPKIGEFPDQKSCKPLLKGEKNKCLVLNEKQVQNTTMITFRLNMSQELTTPYGNMPTSAVRLGQRHVLAV